MSMEGELCSKSDSFQHSRVQVTRVSDKKCQTKTSQRPRTRYFKEIQHEQTKPYEARVLSMGEVDSSEMKHP